VSGSSSNALPKRKGKTSTQAEVPGKYGTSWFVPYRLTEADKAAARGYADDPIRLFTWICDVVSNGYKVSLNYSSKSESFTATLSRPDRDGSGRTGLLVAHGRSVESALAGLYYIHEGIYQGIWPSPTERGVDLFD